MRLRNTEALAIGLMIDRPNEFHSLRTLMNDIHRIYEEHRGWYEVNRACGIDWDEMNRLVDLGHRSTSEK
jgi:hypothetical protein